MKNSVLNLRPASAFTGTVISDIDLREPIPDSAVAEMKNALFETGVLFFRSQNLEPAHQMALAEKFGPVPDAEFLKTVDGFPAIGLIEKQADQVRNVGGNWHSDHSFDEIPPLGSCLYAQVLPESGGDTLFANMATAYDSLSDGLKKTVETLKVVHAKKSSFYNDPRPERQVSPKELAKIEEELGDRFTSHPVVVRHPETGRKCLFVNPTYASKIDGWTEAESKPFLEMLYAHATRPENTTRFSWEDGSIAFWDNRTAMHYAINDYQGQYRMLHRVVVAGAPFQTHA
ncbi:MAG: hypothetical protein HOF95_09130 [Rhodospirillales bacterium]|jgi:taurine dioxygenase|nr:hypothetical protein [Rhodospirillales bacterium]MBT4007639.1 hypothetical protein [Rhodospirillales bacterium]MBT5075957.1 hypothetical protein [Rhodospirillales bacterium]MBT5113000.1 hypothetical protein [Rhodospirillales bacterium]MBT5672876.1 hypothetical protein [Rhodospirillales bacterium]